MVIFSCEQSLFHTPLNLYDIILRVRPSKIPYPLRVLFPQDITAAGKLAPELSYILGNHTVSNGYFLIHDSKSGS